MLIAPKKYAIQIQVELMGKTEGIKSKMTPILILIILSMLPTFLLKSRFICKPPQIILCPRGNKSSRIVLELKLTIFY